jgi:multidrug efflux pump subunit AcrB
MSELSIDLSATEQEATEHWTALHAKPIVFVIVTLVAVGVYLAFTIPVSVFPETNFPRIVIGVDNGVMPIDQIFVTVTKPIEEAVNSVKGWRGLVRHESRISRNRSVLLLESGHVSDARTGECSPCAYPRAAEYSE